MNSQASGWRLLLTRPQADCEALAANLAEQGVYGSCMPLLEIRPLPADEARMPCCARLTAIAR